jgi:hypothetical protein
MFEIWQDGVFTLGQLTFFLALIPTIRAEEKPSFTTGVITSLVLTVYIPTVWTLGLYVSVFFTTLLACGWWLLTFQSWKKSRHTSSKRQP